MINSAQCNGIVFHVATGPKRINVRFLSSLMCTCVCVCVQQKKFRRVSSTRG